jgi:hypothetical protein
MAGEDSILTSTKAALGLLEDDTNFDAELIMHINSVLSTYNQLGLGPLEGYAITDKTQTWTAFLGSELRYNDAKSLLYLRVKMLFDPPTVGYVVTSYEKVIEEMTWRLNIAREEIDHPAPVLVIDDEDEDIGGEFVILDGGGP